MKKYLLLISLSVLLVSCQFNDGTSAVSIRNEYFEEITSAVIGEAEFGTLLQGEKSDAKEMAYGTYSVVVVTKSSIKYSASISIYDEVITLCLTEDGVLKME